MRTVAVIVAAAALLALASTAQGKFIDCTPAGADASGLAVTVTPDNPKPGESYTYSSSYTLDKTVTSGTATYHVYLNGLPISTSSQDLCTALAKTPTPCPLQKGPISSTTKGTIPDDTPSGNLTSVTSWVDQDKNPVLCVNLQFNIA